MSKKGFTLIELLIVIAIIAVLAGAVFVALDPLTRFRDARDSRRWADVAAILSAIRVDQVDNGGQYMDSVKNLVADEVYMIVDGAAMIAGCDDNDLKCDADVTSDAHCVNLAGLKTDGYLGTIPVSPGGEVTWDDGNLAGEEGTGYTLKRNTNGSITVTACESENTSSISASR